MKEYVIYNPMLDVTFISSIDYTMFIYNGNLYYVDAICEL